MATSLRILFVDDDTMVLQGLRRALHRQRADWEMLFASRPESALAELRNTPADVVVSDIRMPGMDGVEFLERIAETWPATVRIILSGVPERETLLRSVGPAPQFLTKPCSAERLIWVVERAMRLRRELSDPKLLAMIGRLKVIPSPPSIYLRLMETLRNDRIPIEGVSRVVAQDLAFSTRVLQVANSPVFALPMMVSDVTHAVRLLGLDTLRSLALTHGLVASTRGLDLGGLDIEQLWLEGVQCGAVARHIALNLRAPADVANEASQAGLLHGIGQLLLAVNDPRRHRAARAAAAAGQMRLTEAEGRLFGFNHALAGAYLLHLWGFPDAVVDGVAGWPLPSAASPLPATPTTADFVHIARLAMSVGQTGSDMPITADDLKEAGADTRRLTAFGLQADLPQWIRGCPHLGHSRL